MPEHKHTLITKNVEATLTKRGMSNQKQHRAREAQ